MRGRAAARRGLGRTAPQGLETVNSKRFVSIGNSGGGVTTTTTTTTTTAGAASPVAAAAASTGVAGEAMPPAALTASSPVTSPAAAAAPAADADAAEGPTGLHQAVKRPLQSPDSHSDAVMSPRLAPPPPPHPLPIPVPVLVTMSVPFQSTRASHLKRLNRLYLPIYY